MKVAVLSAGMDKPYALGIAGALLEKGVEVDFIGNNELQKEPIFSHSKLNYFNLRGDQSSDASFSSKVTRILVYYYKLMKYAGSTETKLFHILWLNKFIFFDSTLLNIYYKLNHKKLVYTAHNVNMKARDGGDNILNRISLKFLYWIMDHIFVHTKAMKDELIREFGVRDEKVTVIPFGINSTVPETDLDSSRARKALNLCSDDVVLLFFGNIAPYKGLEILVDAFNRVAVEVRNVKLVIAGPIKGAGEYWEGINSIISKYDLDNKIIKRIEFIPDDEVEIFFKAADALVLPYKFIYQSGPLFLAYHFGLPVIANNVGSFKDDIVEEKTGFLSDGNDAKRLADAITRFIHSCLYREREHSREFIKAYASKKYSWDSIAETIVRVYERV
jgi:glycosyltransferase involved in cell wall biosynthesis